MYIGVDVGGANLVASVVDAKGTILAKAKRFTKSERGASGIIEDCVSFSFFHSVHRMRPVQYHRPPAVTMQ